MFSNPQIWDVSLRVKERQDTMKNNSNAESSLVLSYLELRRAIGVLGVALPFVVFLGALIIFQTGMQNSISGYYYTGMRNVLVGTLCVFGVFLWSYKGYDDTDNLAGNLACVFAVGAALFPTAPNIPDPSVTALWVGRIHVIFASLFFCTLIYFALFLFTKKDPHSKRPLTKRKKQRNNVYRGCGYTMAACIVLIFVYFILPDAQVALFEPIKPVFWLETIAILAFGISWLIKGQTLLKD
jgi:hypothetical protein